MQLNAQKGVSSQVRSGRKAVVVRAAKHLSAPPPPPAWPQRVVPPEVQHRKEPKVQYPKCELHEPAAIEPAIVLNTDPLDRLAAVDGSQPPAALNCICKTFSQWTCCGYHLQRFSLLGSTGSIGTQTLDIIAEFPDKFELVALAAGSNIKLLAEQVGSLACKRQQ